jgi:hypothetical protein
MTTNYLNAPLPGQGYADLCDVLGYLPETPVGEILAVVTDLKIRATVVDSFEQPKTVKFSVIENPRKKGKTHADHPGDQPVADLDQ